MTAFRLSRPLLSSEKKILYTYSINTSSLKVKVTYLYSTDKVHAVTFIIPRLSLLYFNNKKKHSSS